MFKKFKDIDDAFQQVRLQCLLAIFSTTIVGGLAVYWGFGQANKAERTIWVLINGQAFAARATNTADDLRVEARDHLMQFHRLVFNLDPDAKLIERNMRKAFNLADGSAQRFYENLKEAGYLDGIVGGNIRQQVEIDSVGLEPADYPYLFRFQVWAQEKLIRASSVTVRSMLTTGMLSQVQRSNDNSHGMLIEGFRVVENH